MACYCMLTVYRKAKYISLKAICVKEHTNTFVLYCLYVLSLVYKLITKTYYNENSKVF